MKLVNQRHANDCTIAAVAMCLGWSYDRVRSAYDDAQARMALPEYVPGGESGLVVGNVLIACRQRFVWRGARDVPDHLLWNGLHRTPSLLSVQSLARPDGLHAVVYANGLIYDPSPGTPKVTLAHANATMVTTYFGFEAKR